jgi:hypothetical protein
LRQVDLSPGSFLAKLPNSLAELEAYVRGHPLSIDLVEALYLAHALSATRSARAGRPPPIEPRHYMTARNRCPDLRQMIERYGILSARQIPAIAEPRRTRGKSDD